VTSDFVVQTIDERLVAWRELEKEAAEAEKAVAALGQAAADPRVQTLLASARLLREKSDREFASILRAVNHQ